MVNPTSFPDWIQYIRLSASCIITVALGIHAFYQHKQESVEAVSPRKWMYWLYAVIFLLAASVNLTQLCVTAAFRNYEKASYHVGYSTILLMFSYLTILAGVKRKTY
jgi:heme A synthase